ncbi:hypothetical protein [Sandaracinus amylolyticus]|uniref:hypothetical protein n=1 Tax=Sandaracinus amylolyticus TaxID=927083 RepID=UPI001F2DA742|nr:hypothetical protein [Sandaracinus amylolyticus]UJR85844.1 Hypothetical protein I5071_79240 [Sandaracinus amylolyticus]
MDASTRAIGIASALTLVATLCWQLRAQWRKGTSEGVSRFLFAGQLGASTGFAIYSALIEDAVFVATNVATGVAAVAGLAITIALRRRARRARSWRAGEARRHGAAASHGAGRAAPLGSA